jgi:hypothetical protein
LLGKGQAGTALSLAEETPDDELKLYWNTTPGQVFEGPGIATMDMAGGLLAARARRRVADNSRRQGDEQLGDRNLGHIKVCEKGKGRNTRGGHDPPLLQVP